MILITRPIAVIFIMPVLSGPAIAALGGNEASIVADQTQMKATRRVVKLQKFTMHEMQVDSGTIVREYVSVLGQIFAVTWKGPFLPNFQQILGGSFAGYLTAQRSRHTRARRGSLLIQQPDLVVQSGGHMRSFSGIAYIPQLLPKYVTVDEIQ